MMTEWPTDKTLQFVREYKKRTVLWDKDHPHYRVGDRKTNAWCEMAAIFNTDTYELKKKLNSLLASYRRERQKVRTRPGAYSSTWFAYKLFTTFLQDRSIQNTGRYITQDEHDDSVDLDNPDAEVQMEYVKTENTEETVYSPDENLTMLNGIEEQENTEDYSVQPPRKLRRITEDDQRAYETPTEHRRNDCDVFGEYISGKMRNFDHKTKCVTQYLISNVLFQADIGKFKDATFDYEGFLKCLLCRSVSTVGVNVNNDEYDVK